MYSRNSWMTFYYVISVGTFGASDSHVRAYVAYENGPLRSFIDMPDYPLQGSAETDSFDMVHFGPYMTNKSAALDHPTAYTWYDELIVSTNPIWNAGEVPHPLTDSRPNPPGQLDSQ